ncbi:hypothetical protein TPHA_0D01310 [Tetrapisispora phaffii CBS 4417]|uniref:Vacuolar membrane protein n=1 Tax=Tetrapisispora phaffii (strain ATCC 24235 / CBS 4417 / NBRC 1672 / NRRL Y-8282 / UCD 70-5) TaxID=1071381 RepID=G8BSF1_TETPH|nr:hypothetical protein TPHA_0D01310 [Tetrapisispora phaffii CBS 4417]CCE62772.1 hypothetical protein TPHA_0D01310 [Tetrapisispora phaffii CBS 4417]
MIIRKGDEDEDTCQLLGPVSIGIQVIMGAWIVMSLLMKRNYEHPKRKLIVWTYDVSKQLIGSLLVHFLNLFISVVQEHKANLTFSLNIGDNGSGDEDDQCDYYFLNLLLDTTIGIPIFWVAFTCIEKLFSYYNFKNIESGNYFTTEGAAVGKTSEKPSFVAFLKQLNIFTSGLIVMKLVIFLVLYYFEEFAYWLANMLLGWSDPWPNFQIFLVMFISPIALNLFQYYCVDNIIKLHSDHLTQQNAHNFEPITAVEDNAATDYINSISCQNSMMPGQSPAYDNDSSNKNSKYGSI